MSGNDHHPDDDLLRRARELEEEAEKVSRQSASSKNSPLSEHLSRSKTFGGTVRFFRALKRWTGPVGSFFAWVFSIIFAAIKFCSFKRENGEYVLDDDGNLDFSAARLSKMCLLALPCLVVLHMTVSAAYYYGTYFEETVYVTGKQEIETGELYQFGGCTSLPCSTEADNGKFYLIRSSLYFPALFYPEEEVFANIPQQDGACAIEGYGIYFRALRWIYKNAQLYQHVVQVSCRPYTQDEIRQMILAFGSPFELVLHQDTGKEQFSLGHYVFSQQNFQRLIHYVIMGGFPKWLDGIAPDYVIKMQKSMMK